MAAALSEPTAASLSLTGSVPVVDAGSVHVSSDVATVATVVAQPRVRTTALPSTIGLVGDPADMLTKLATTVVTVNEDPVLRVADISICVLRYPLTRSSFTVVWVE